MSESRGGSSGAGAGGPGTPGRLRAWSRRHAPLLAALIATLFCALTYGGHSAGMIRVPGLDALELLTLDARFQLRGKRDVRSDRIVIVGLDDETRRRTPIIFQKRKGWAELIDRLAEHEPKAIGIDALYSSPEASLPGSVAEDVREAYAELEGQENRSPAAEGALRALEGVVESLRGDEALADAIARAETVQLAILFPALGGEAAPADAPEPVGIEPARYGESVVVQRPHEERPRNAGAGVQTSIPQIATEAAGAGFINLMVDEDGVLRRVPAVIARAGRYYMPLGLSMALAAMENRAAYVTGNDRVSAGERALPVIERADFQLSFLGAEETFPHISAADVIDGTLDEGALEDKLVFLGYTDEARDRTRTPLDPAFAGVEVHATLAHNILHDELLRRAGPIWALGSIFGLGLLLSLVQLRRIRQQRAWVAPAVGVVALSGYAVAAHALFVTSGLIVSVAAPSLSCVVVALASLSAALATEGREKAKLKAAFSQYVSDALVERIVADPSRARLGGVRRELTVLFSDVRGFSEIAEDLEPEVLSAYMNEYLTPMTRLAMREGGMLDKYIGDALMAVYGAPLAQRDHAAHACRSALAMVSALEPLNAQWRARGLPALSIGIGINSGPMSVGNMGSEARFDYTVLGDAVNLGARLEALTKEYGVGILCGERTAELARDGFVFRELDLVRVKGRAGAARLFELVGTENDAPFSKNDLELFAEGLASYRGQRFERAEREFAAFLQRHPDDGAAQTMQARSRELHESPPGEDWDGVYTQLSK